MGIKPENAQVHWREERRGGAYRIAEVEVFDRFRPWEDHEELDCSAGACGVDWLQGDPRATPEGIYLGWVLDGFVDRNAHLHALRELAKIDGLTWAETMAGALERRIENESR